MQTVRFYRLDKFNYAGFRERLIDLYLHAFTTGKYAQYIVSEAVESTFDSILHEGSVNMAFAGERLVGLIAAFPLERDSDFPKEECYDIPVGQSIYIAEVMVHADYRGRGIASQMMKNLLQEASLEYFYAVIRVWQQNSPALELYKKLGFTPVAVISQQKLNVDGEEFEMKKVYMFKCLR